MLNVALLILTVAVLFGVLLAALHLRGGAAGKVPWPLAALHALFALGGFATLLVALRGPVRGIEQGTAAFGAISGWLLGVALLFGLTIFYTQWRKRARVEMLIGIHATLAVSGFVVLAVYVLS